MDPELFAQWQAEQERARMVYDDATHKLVRFLHGLDEDGLDAVRMMMGAVQGANGPQLANWYQGVVEGLMSVRHGRCVSCGNNHDRALDEIVSPRPPTYPGAV